MPPKMFPMTIDAIENLTPDVRRFGLRSDESLAWVSGQFCSISIDDGQPQRAMRAYSIATAGGEKSAFDLVIKLVSDGRGTPWLWTKTVGERLTVLAPMGHFSLRPAHDGPILLVATGTGIAPMAAFLDDLAAQGFPQSVSLFFGVRSRSDLFWIDRFTALANAHPQRFRFVFALSQPDSDWTGASGRLPAILEAETIDTASTAYLCGSSRVIDSVSAVLAQKGVASERILFEKFG